MWLFFPKVGFLSVVKKRGDSMLTIRARDRKHLENLKRLFIPDLEIEGSKPSNDYAFRAKVGACAWANACSDMACTIDYDNFKHETKKHNPRLAKVCGRIWGELAAEYGAYGHKAPHRMWADDMRLAKSTRG